MKNSHLSIVLNYTAGIIFVLAIQTLLYQDFAGINQAAKIALTLGMAIVAVLIGLGIHRRSSESQLPGVFYLVAAFLMPFAIENLLKHYQDILSPTVYAITFNALLLLIFIVLAVKLKRQLFGLASIIAGQSLYYALIYFLGEENSALVNWHYYAYTVLVSGFSLILFAEAFDRQRAEVIIAYCRNIGLVLSLSILLVLGSSQDGIGLFWRLAYPLIIALAYYISIKFKYSTYLLWATVFLIIDIIWVANMYLNKFFSPAVWLFIAAGLVVVASYVSHWINNRYIKKESNLTK